MHVMVYAPYGRAGIYMMQEYCRLLGVSASAADLRDLGSVSAFRTGSPKGLPVAREHSFAGIEPPPRSIVAAGLIGSRLRGPSAMC